MSNSWKSADECVESLSGLEVSEIGLLEARVGDTESGSAAARSLHRRSGAVDSEHRASRAHEAGGQQRYIAHPAADVEHGRALAQPGATKNIGAEFLEQCTLLRETPRLQLGVAERIILCPAHGASRNVRAA